MKPCTEKAQYPTQEMAEDAVRKTRKALKRNGGGHGLRKLNAYFCDQHQCWHVGRSSRYGVKLIVEREKQPPTVGELRRRVRNLERRMDSERKHKAYVIGKIVAADRAWLEAESERAKVEADRARDYAETIAIAKRMVAQHFAARQ